VEKIDVLALIKKRLSEALPLARSAGLTSLAEGLEAALLEAESQLRRQAGGNRNGPNNSRDS